jgi:hypothetical protein
MYFDQLYQVASAQAAPWHTKIRGYEDDFFRAIKSKDAGARTDVFDLVLQMTSVFQQARTTFRLSRPGDSTVDRMQAEAGENYVRHILKVMDKRRGYKLVSSFARNQLMRSAGVFHWLFNNNPTPGLEDVISPFHNPHVDVWSIDPKKVMPIYGVAPIGDLQAIFHVETRSVQSVLNFVMTNMAGTGVLEALMQERPRWFDPTISFTELNDMTFQLENYWGWHDFGGKFVVYNALRFDDILIRPFTPMPNYKVLPWSIRPAIDTGADKLEDRFLPIHIAARVHSEALEEWQGYVKNIVRKLSDQMFVLKRGAGRSTENSYEILANNNYVLQLEDGDELVPPNFAPLSPDVWRQTDVIGGQLEVSGLPRSSWGTSSGEGSSFQFDRAQDGARLKFVPPHEGLVSALEDMARGIMSLSSSFYPGVAIYTLTKKLGRKSERVVLTGQDISPALWDIEVNLDARLPGDETRDATVGNMWYAAGNGILSGRTVRERYARVENVEEEEERIIAEKARMGDERIRNAVAIDILDRMDALPPMSPQQEFEINYTVDTMRARGNILGLPPEQIERAVSAYLDGERQRYLSSLQAPPQGAPPGPGPNAPAPPQDPTMGGGMAPGTAGMAGLMGMAPAGSGADPMALERSMQNQLSGTVGKQQ